MKNPALQTQEAYALSFASFLRQQFEFYRPDILGLDGGATTVTAKK
jgi:hypothetical protein